jgi:hypothetical protein
VLEVDVQTPPQLRSAIAQARAAGTKLVATLQNGIALGQTFNINGDVTIVSHAQLFYVGLNGRLHAEKNTFSDGYTSTSGGAIYNDGAALKLKNCKLTGTRRALIILLQVERAGELSSKRMVRLICRAASCQRIYVDWEDTEAQFRMTAARSD